MGASAYPSSMDGFKLTARIILSSAAGVLVFLGATTAYGDDIGGVPSWERCSSWLGNPMIEWPGGNLSPLFSLALGAGVGISCGGSSERTELDRVSRSPICAGYGRSVSN
jgi:hypothetical protein